MLRKHVYTLASDSLLGRKTGTIGQHKAVAYCTYAIRTCHLFAPFPIDSTRLSHRQTFPITIKPIATYGPPSGLHSDRAYVPTEKQAELVNRPMSRRDSSRALFGINVGGVIPGTDLKREIIVLSAHYDHLGASGGRIFHGADDNASGTAAVLGVAAVFDSLAQLGIRSRRTVLFMLFSGEEDGLLGSAYFINHSPVDPRRILYNLNADMIGRVDAAHRNAPDYCYVITDSNGNGLKQIVETVNAQTVGLQLNQGGYDAVDDPDNHFQRSDQYNFALAGIPALLFSNGEHSDYHRPTDTAKKIRYDVLQKRATLLFQVAWALANP
ncbi:M28 family peptidase [Spirosoma rhododendri]|uniref:M28 family peptidase n=1 Tax=Spirosoma rhododendri TaxID=2728024 RepID=A0A7L5DXX9_9BACT|nr:M28 family peptidase [Spirosoma rhododendri]QJD80827.1 M28 family peptidase [Spirosoma rhododendri]